MKRFALVLSVLLPLAACNNPPPPATTDTAPAASDAAAPSAAAEAAAAASAADPGTPADAVATPAADAPATPADAPATPAGGADAGALVAGTDYVEIPGGQPYMPLNGKIEVVEVFGYVCPACARFQPLVSAWEKTLPADVRFSYVPAPFGPQWIPYAKAYYVAESMGLVDRTHDAIFQAIHIEHSLPGEGEQPDEAAIAAFYGKHGADPKQFLAAMHSFATDAKVNRGKQFMLRSGVGGTPTVVVNGKYRVTTNKSYEDILRVTDALVARERAARATPAQ